MPDSSQLNQAVQPNDETFTLKTSHPSPIHLDQNNSYMLLSRLFIIAKVQTMIPLVALTLKIAGIERTARWLIGKNSNTNYAPEKNTLKHAMHIFKIQRKAVSKALWSGNCLSRSLVLHWLLKQQGIRSEFCIGVRTQPSFKAHAWVTFENRPLNVSKQALSDYKLVSNFKLIQTEKFE